MTDRFRIPHTLVLLFMIMIVALVATWFLPQGSFQTAPNEAGRMMVIPGSYQVHDERVWLSPAVLFTAIPRAMADAQAIIFFLLIVGGAIAVLRATGVIDALLGWLLKRIGHNPALLIIFGTAAFTAGSGTLGVSTEYIPFAVVLISLCMAMRLDAMTAMGIMICGYCVGYGVAWTNPYTVLVAQEIAGLQPTSGIGLRLALFVPFVAIAAHHIWRYARRVAADPAASLVADLDDPRHSAVTEYPPFDRRHALIGLIVLAGIAAMVYGMSQRGWYLVELGAIWLAVALTAGLVARLGLDETAKRFVAGACELAVVALLVGFARSIALILEDGQVLHSIVHGASIPLSWVGTELAAVGMLAMQTLINFFIPSGSGQAFATMPIMAPLADVVGIERQVAVLAFQFGDGFSNMILPTNIVLMAILGMAGIPYDRWFRFAWPLFLKLLLAAAVALVAAVLLGYS
ncbi:YfcC family protein [Luteimonas sp. SJ-92]|uniref:YfcC family protein n=1 Tax=Luteimonas salinisoli TaxID=2752307 RepID=A0A853J9B5_9GAMM|nr:TIGR00366 family protein [Luteimonas salinisoli]NZA25372.1 YfcC family protein [Luteimonas salinisoli]